MALVVKDRVKETTSTTGTGAVTLGGAPANFAPFSDVLSDGDTTYYAIVDNTNIDWEVGLGTYASAGDTLTRTTVLASSNSGSAVDFSAGSKDVFITYASDKAVFLDANDKIAGDQTFAGTVTLNADPASGLQAATKQYVDTLAAASLHYHDPVRVEQEGNLTATYDNGTAGVGATLTNSGTQAALVIDGVTLSNGDRVLIYEQTNAFENGIYTVTDTGSASTNWVLTRATDADSYSPSDPDSLGEGDAFFVLEGTAGAGELYVMNTSGSITFGTTGISFAQVSSAQVYTGGTGISIAGSVISSDITLDEVTANGATTANNISVGTVTFTNLNDGAITITGFVDQDDMASDSASLLPTQQSVKAYVDNSISAFSTTLDGLTDTTITSVGDNEVLAYDSATGKWINQTAAEASLATAAQGSLADTALQSYGSIDNHTDVDTSTVAPTDGQILTWDNTAGQWEPADANAGGAYAEIWSWEAIENTSLVSVSSSFFTDTYQLYLIEYDIYCDSTITATSDNFSVTFPELGINNEDVETVMQHRVPYDAFTGGTNFYTSRKNFIFNGFPIWGLGNNSNIKAESTSTYPYYATIKGFSYLYLPESSIATLHSHIVNDSYRSANTSFWEPRFHEQFTQTRSYSGFHGSNNWYFEFNGFNARAYSKIRLLGVM